MHVYAHLHTVLYMYSFIAFYPRIPSIFRAFSNARNVSLRVSSVVKYDASSISVVKYDASSIYV